MKNTSNNSTEGMKNRNEPGAFLFISRLRSNRKKGLCLPLRIYRYPYFSSMRVRAKGIGYVVLQLRNSLFRRQLARGNTLNDALQLADTAASDRSLDGNGLHSRVPVLLRYDGTFGIPSTSVESLRGLRLPSLRRAQSHSPYSIRTR